MCKLAVWPSSVARERARVEFWQIFWNFGKVHTRALFSTWTWRPFCLFTRYLYRASVFRVMRSGGRGPTPCFCSGRLDVNVTCNGEFRKRFRASVLCNCSCCFSFAMGLTRFYRATRLKGIRESNFRDKRLSFDVSHVHFFTLFWALFYRHKYVNSS